MVRTIFKQVEPDKIPLSKKAIEQKQAKLEKLLVLRKEVIKRLITSREMGDLSENGAYSAAKFELASVDRQTRQLKYILANAYIPKIDTSTVASFGKKITLKNTQSSLTFVLVGQYESDVSNHKFSLESPIGQAVFGKKAGDEVTVISPKGKVKYLISSVTSLPI